MTAIESKEIKGITLKVLWSIIFGTATIVSSVVICYFNLKDNMTQLQYQLTGAKEYYEIRFKGLDQKTDFNSIGIKDLNYRVDNLKTKQ